MQQQVTGACATRAQRWVTLGWFYDRGGRRLGPFSNEELQRQVSAGDLPRSQTVYIGWQKDDDVQFLETELRFALGEPGDSLKFTDPAVVGEVKPMARPTTGCRSAGSTEHGPDIRTTERRKHVRRPRSGVVSYFSTEDENAVSRHAVRVVEVSRGGIGILDDRRYAAGTPLTLCFDGEGEVTTLLAAAHVVRAQAWPRGLWHLGCRFSAELGEREFGQVLDRTERREAAP